ncbi:uncharacterized protein LOC110300927 [Mus caroli]|uniref:Uncharacterized protein LOC110300927 n=1 Tax=Mus caroli TaxID=10089 RepID=A0A6P7RGP1_MUSCR|nr:uncharacterized protein LOC110300927 [Mus caroli]
MSINMQEAATLHEAPGGHRHADHGRRGLVPRVPRHAPERRPLGTDGPNPSEVSGTQIPVVPTLAPPRPSVTDRTRDPPLGQGRAGRGAAAERGRASRSLKPDSTRPRPQRHAWLARAARSPRPHVHTPAALPFRSVRPTRGRPGLRRVPPLGGSRVGVGGPRPFGGSRAGVGGPRLLGWSRVASAGLGRSAGLRGSSASGRRLGPPVPQEAAPPRPRREALSPRLPGFSLPPETHSSAPRQPRLKRRGRRQEEGRWGRVQTKELGRSALSAWGTALNQTEGAGRPAGKHSRSLCPVPGIPSQTSLWAEGQEEWGVLQATLGPAPSP